MLGKGDKFVLEMYETERIRIPTLTIMAYATIRAIGSTLSLSVYGNFIIY